MGLAVDYSAHVGHTIMTISGDKEGLYLYIILSVGLAVDYSAHVGHTIMTISGDKEGLY